MGLRMRTLLRHIPKSHKMQDRVESLKVACVAMTNGALAGVNYWLTDHGPMFQVILTLFQIAVAGVTVAYIVAKLVSIVKSWRNK